MATIRDAGIHGEFVHERSRDPLTEIRLIHIDLSGEMDSDIYCTVSAHSIGDATPYIAVSYTWGDISEKRSIWVNNKRLYLGPNSWIVLWQARLHGLNDPLWMDVLSIDQANDSEKSIQVGLMGTIYRTARYALISVGSHGSDSEYLAEQIHAHTRYIEEMRRAHGEQRDPPLRERSCSSCGEELSFDDHRCTACSMRFCDFCKLSAAEHENIGHRLLVERVEYLRTPGCLHCGQKFATRWYECKHKAGSKSFLVCRTCKEEREHEYMNEQVESFLRDMWGDVSKPAGVTLVALRVALQLLAKFKNMSQPSHQRLVDALEAFSLRPYFTRLWVCKGPKKSYSEIDADIPDIKDRSGISSGSQHCRCLWQFEIPPTGTQGPSFRCECQFALLRNRGHRSSRTFQQAQETLSVPVPRNATALDR